MATQPPITTFFGSKKRRAVDDLDRKSKLLKGDATLMKVTKIDSGMGIPDDSYKNTEKSETCRKVIEQTTPRKSKCDIRSYMTAKSPYRPDCKSVTPIKFFRTEPKAQNNETTPVKPVSCLKKFQVPDRPASAVKKSIRFEDDDSPAVAPVVESPEIEDTDAIIKAANDLVEKVKNKNKILSNSSKPKKPEVMTAAGLKKKLARTAKLAELKASLNKLGKQASELIKLEKSKKEADEPKITKFDAIEVDVPRSPHKGALSSPAKSPAKPAYERFAHLVHRTGPVSATSTLPLPLGYQRLLDLFIATDQVCSMMMNRGEIITFRKLKPAVQELTRKTLTERHLAQMAAVLPAAYDFRQEKMRNFGSTSKIDRYELVVSPCIEGLAQNVSSALPVDSNLVRAADRKKMTPKMLQLRKDAFSRDLVDRTINKHEEFLADLDPPLIVNRGQLTRWHPNFPLDMVPDVAPVSLPEPPNVGQAPTCAKDVLERAKQLLNGNCRVRRALEITSTSMEELNKAGTKAEPDVQGEDLATNSVKPSLDSNTKAAIDKKVESHNPLKGISKSLLDKIRAKQAAKALETMKMSPADEQELLLLSKLAETARVVRTLFVDNQKGVLPWETVVEKVIFSNKRNISKSEVEIIIKRLVEELPNWLSIFTIKTIDYLKLNRFAPFSPIMEKLEKMAADRRKALT